MFMYPCKLIFFLVQSLNLIAARKQNKIIILHADDFKAFSLTDILCFQLIPHHRKWSRDPTSCHHVTGKRLSANGIAPFSVWPGSSGTPIAQWSVTASTSGVSWRVGWWQTPYTWLLTLRWTLCCYYACCDGGHSVTVFLWLETTLCTANWEKVLSLCCCLSLETKLFCVRKI